MVAHLLGLPAHVLPTQENMATHPAASMPWQQVDVHPPKALLARELQPGAVHQPPHLESHAMLPHLVLVSTTISPLLTVHQLLQRVLQRRDLCKMLQRPEAGREVRLLLLLRGERIQSRYCIRGLMHLRQRRVLRPRHLMGLAMGLMRQLLRRGMGRGILIVMRSE